MRVTLYSKPECPLCDEVRRDLLDLQRRTPFTLEVCNILDDPEAVARFQYLIPVVDIEGGPLLTPPHDWLTLDRAISVAHAALPERAEERMVFGTGSG